MSDSNALANARSFLFVPANRPERFSKALLSGADAVILDLEDSVPDHAKGSARAAITASWADLQESPIPIVVRVNGPETDHGKHDLEQLKGLPGLGGLMIPKCESSVTLKLVSEIHPGTSLFPIIESAAGFLRLEEIALSEGVARLVVGHIDFLADTGLQSSDDQHELDTLRFKVAMCSRVGGLAPAIDGVTVSVDNELLIRADTRRSIQFGFGGKLCIHPKQIAAIHSAFEPSNDQIRWARQVVNAMTASQGSAVQLDGKMVDLPVLLQARRLLSRMRKPSNAHESNGGQ